jgi:hypothetical protein
LHPHQKPQLRRRRGDRPGHLAKGGKGDRYRGYLLHEREVPDAERLRPHGLPWLPPARSLERANRSAEKTLGNTKAGGVVAPGSKSSPHRHLIHSSFRVRGKGATRSQSEKSEAAELGDLQDALLSLPFEAFAMLLAQLLEALGYRDVQPAGRNDWKGRNRDGGVDLFASLPGGVASRRVVVQLKQFGRGQKLYQKHIDELRGVALRHRASEAVLVSCGPLSPSVHLHELDSLPVPVRLIDGERLHSLLFLHRLGITERGAVDRAFFEALASAASGNGPGDCTGKSNKQVEGSLHIHLNFTHL